MRLRRGNARKKGVSAIIGGLFVFLIIFSVVAAYFVFDYRAQTSVNLAANEQALLNSQANSENFTITVPQAQGQQLGINVTNLGPNAIQIGGIFTSDYTTGRALAINNLLCSSPCTKQTVVINSGDWSILNTNYTWPGAAIVIKVTTTLGTSRAVIYPFTSLGSGSSGTGSLTSDTIGDIYLDFQSYTFYTVTTTGCSGTPGPEDTSYCLKTPREAFTICCGTQSGNLSQNSIAFSIKVRNVNPSFLNITLDGYSQFFQFFPQGSSLRSVFWYIISVDSSSGETYVQQNYNPASGFLPNTYNQAVAPEVTLFFANYNPAGSFQTVVTKGSNALPAPELVSTFIFAHGWKGIGDHETNLITSVGVQNYGQNIPFVTTEYCDIQGYSACYS